jgi:hypothetical protein
MFSVDVLAQFFFDYPLEFIEGRYGLDTPHLDFLVTDRTENLKDFTAGRKLSATGNFVPLQSLHELNFVGGVVPFASGRIDLFAFGGLVVRTVRGCLKHR